MTIEVEVKPKDGFFVGWDVHVISWKAGYSGITIHKISWAEESEGIFVGTTADLPSGPYGVRAELFGPGTQIEVTVRGNRKVLQPDGNSWPMKVEVDSATGTQFSDTWYFEVAK